MKHLYPLLLFMCLYPASIFAQVDSTNNQTDSLRKDSVRPKQRTIRITDSTRVIKPKILQIDSLQLKDSVRIKDSLQLIQQVADKTKKAIQKHRSQR